MRAGVSRVLIGIAASGALVSASPAGAQNWPEKPVRLIVPFPPGGNIDINGRVIAPGLGEILGHQVVVDNRPGAAGTIGVDMVAKAAPDGYALVVGSTGTISAAPALYRKLPYDPLRDLVAVALVSDAPIVVVVHPAIRARNARDLVNLARERPGRMTMGSAGTGSTNHLAGELFQFRTKVKLTHVPYKGSGPALVDLMGGQIDVYFDQLTSSLGFIRSGKLRALALAQPARTRLLPDVPTLAEQGIQGAEASTYAGVFGPIGMPRALVERLNAAIIKVVSAESVRERFAGLGAEVKPLGQEAFASFVREDLEKWRRVVRESGITLEL